MKRWYSKYHGDGFDIVGVHYGEFAIGYNADNVREAAKRFLLPWPVVADLQGSIWREYHSDVWPNRYLIDQNGDIVLHIEGEGNNEAMEENIRELLFKTHPEVTQVPIDPPENTFAPSCGIPTDETYVGIGSAAVQSRIRRATRTTAKSAAFARRERLPMARSCSLVNGSHNRMASPLPAGDRAQLRYHARSAYAVLSGANPKKPLRVYLLQDGKPLDSSHAGVDIHFDSTGSYLDVSGGRKILPGEKPGFGSHLLALEPQSPDFVLHSFTYGNDCQQEFEQK